MRKTLAVMLMVGLVAGAFAVPAEAKKKKKKAPPAPVKIERVVEAPYQSPALGHSDAVIGCLLVAEGLGCVHAMPGEGEKYVKVEIMDASGQTSYGAIAQDLDGDGLGDTDYPSFCGTTGDTPFEIQEGYELDVYINAGPSPTCQGIGTSGTVVFTFSNIP